MGGWLSVSSLPIGFTNAEHQARSAAAFGDETGELKALEQVLAYTPWRGDLWERAGRLRLNQNKGKEAAAAFSNAYDHGGLSEQGKVWWADALISSGEEERASSILAGLKSVDPVVLRQAAALQIKLQEIPSAISSLERALQLQPDDPEMNFQVGVIIAGIDPNRAHPYLQKAENSATVGQLAEYLDESLQLILELELESDRFFQTGQLLAGVEEWESALNALQKAVELDPNASLTWALLGEVQQQVGLDGYAALQKAWQLSPEDEIVNGLLGVYYRRQGKLDLALHYLNEAIELNPNSINWEIEMGNLLADEGELDAALAHYQSAVHKDPQKWSSWRELAVFCIKHNYKVNEAAIPAVREALLLNPASPALLDLMGTAYMMVNELESAERFFLQAEELDPGQAAILIHLGQLALYRDDREKALAYFRQAAQSAQDERLRDLAIQLIRENGGND